MEVLIYCSMALGLVMLVAGIWFICEYFKEPKMEKECCGGVSCEPTVVSAEECCSSTIAIEEIKPKKGTRVRSAVTGKFVKKGTKANKNEVVVEKVKKRKKSK